MYVGIAAEEAVKRIQQAPGAGACFDGAQDK